MIISLVKISVFGQLRDKERILADLQDLGCLHLIPLKIEADLRSPAGLSSEIREALKFLQCCRQRRRQVHDLEKFDAIIVGQVLDLKSRIQKLEDERDFLHRRIMDLKPWGEFSVPPPEALGNLRLWFYIIHHYELKKIEKADLIWEVVGQDNRFSYLVVVSEAEPPGMPVPPLNLGSHPLSELERRLEEVELELEDMQAERAGLTRWIYLFARSLSQLEDQAALFEAAHQTYDESPIFALQAWAPRENVEELHNYAENSGLALEVAEPEPGETPPTLLRTQPSLVIGQDLVSFYMTPSYWLWDPSTIVFFSFALFFGMILADAGYALIMGLGLALGWRRMGKSDLGHRLRILFTTLIIATLVYGVLLGSYFGLAPPKGTWLFKIKIIDLNDFGTMMQLSILIGVVHLILANLGDAWHRRRSSEVWAPIGWVMIFLGAVAVWMGFSGVGRAAGLKTAGFWAMGLGGAAVLLFTRVEGGFGHRLVGGLQGLTRLSGAFGDTLSYLRLFALGLASASLAITFNGLAKQVYLTVPGLKLLLALLIILLGHSLNLVLAIVSGFIHGLRLNYIEFFNWSLPEEGYSFRAFARKEKS